MAYVRKPEWVNPETILRLRNGKFGPLEVVHERCRSDPEVQRLKIVDPKNPEDALSFVKYWPHLPERKMIYVRDTGTREDCRNHGMLGSLLSLLSAHEGKKVFLIPNGFAQERRIYESLGFKRDRVLWAGEKTDCLSVNNARRMKPQDWVEMNKDGRRIRKFFIENWEKKVPDARGQKRG